MALTQVQFYYRLVFSRFQGSFFLFLKRNHDCHSATQLFIHNIQPNFCRVDDFFAEFFLVKFVYRYLLTIQFNFWIGTRYDRRLLTYTHFSHNNLGQVLAADVLIEEANQLDHRFAWRNLFTDVTQNLLCLRLFTFKCTFYAIHQAG